MVLLPALMRLTSASVMFADWLQGDVVALLGCVDTNWYEGKLEGRQGLFPISYVEQLVDGVLSPSSSPRPLGVAVTHAVVNILIFKIFYVSLYPLLCFDTVVWATGRASGL